MSRAGFGDLQVVQPSPTTPFERAVERHESDWHTLYRLAGVSALTVVGLIPIQALAYILWPPPTTVLGFFSVFQGNPLLGFVDLDLLLIIDQLLIVTLLLGLYVALQRSSPSLMLIGLASGLLGAVLLIVSREATLTTFALSQQYELADSNSERVALEAAGQTLLAMYNGTSFSFGYFLSGLGMVLISTVMLRSSVFSRLTGIAGVAAGVTGLVPASLGTLGLVLSFVSLLPLIVWLFMVGQRLLRLSWTR